MRLLKETETIAAQITLGYIVMGSGLQGIDVTIGDGLNFYYIVSL